MKRNNKLKRMFFPKGLTIVLFLTTLIMSGCFGPTPEANWDEVVTSYDYNTNTFKDYEGTIVIGDKVKSIEWLSTYGVSKVVLRSNPTPLYLKGSGTSDVDDGDNDLTNNFNSGDEIVFEINIKEDNFGEYIVEMSR